MRNGFALLIWGSIADMAVQNDEGRPALGLPEDLECVLDPIDVVRIADAQNVPAIRQEPRCDVFRERDVGIAFDRDVVVVEDPAKVVQPKMARQRCRFRRNALHQAPIAAHCVDPVIEDFEAGSVVTVGKPFFRDGHSDTGRDTLSEWTRGSFNAGDPAILRVSRRAGCPAAGSAGYRRASLRVFPAVRTRC